MARKLKTCQTSLGSSNQAIAIDERLWPRGADSNLFYQRAAKESKDAATSRSAVLPTGDLGSGAFSNAVRSGSKAPAMLACSGSA